MTPGGWLEMQPAQRSQCRFAAGSASRELKRVKALSISDVDAGAQENTRPPVSKARAGIGGFDMY